MYIERRPADLIIEVGLVKDNDTIGIGISTGTGIGTGTGTGTYYFDSQQ